MSSSSVTTVLLFSLIFGSLVISSNYFPTVFAQTPEEIIDEIQETMGEVEDIGDVLNEAMKVDTMTALTLDLKERVNTLVDDEVLKQELVSILDLALFHLQEASNFVLELDEEQANNSINNAKNYLTEFVSAVEDARTVDSSELKTSQSTKQKKSEGVTPENPLCKNDMQLIFKVNNNKPLCVKPTTAEKLIQRDNFSNLKTYFITYEVYNGFTGPLVCDSGDFAISGGSEGGTSDIANMRMLHQLPDRVVFSSSDQDDDFHLFIYAYCADISEPFR